MRAIEPLMGVFLANIYINFNSAVMSSLLARNVQNIASVSMDKSSTSNDV